jgi:hypothetical protein
LTREIRPFSRSREALTPLPTRFDRAKLPVFLTGQRLSPGANFPRASFGATTFPRCGGLCCCQERRVGVLALDGMSRRAISARAMSRAAGGMSQFKRRLHLKSCTIGQGAIVESSSRPIDEQGNRPVHRKARVKERGGTRVSSYRDPLHTNAARPGQGTLSLSSDGSDAAAIGGGALSTVGRVRTL